MSQSMTRIFVYGTLKMGFPNHHLIESPPSGKVQFLGHGVTKESYPMVIGTDAHIPFVLPFPGKGSAIKGEVYEVDGDALVHLDDLEDHPTWYKRTSCTVIMNSQEINCETYLLTKSKPELLQWQFYNEFTPDQASKYCNGKVIPRVSSVKSQVQLGNE